MKPIYLEMSAFGPFAGKTVIDFAELGEGSIYLITGDTGAGKTTIFDAITFALYGEPSGDNRESSMLRCKYASPDTATYVDFSFECKGKLYRVKRNPAYERPAKRGDGVTREGANSELILPDGTVVNKNADVNVRIIDIIRLDRQQFSRIAMIAQGDFLKLLLAGTKERKDIFRNIFKTDNYNTLQEVLRTKELGAYREYSDCISRLAILSEQILCDSDESEQEFASLTAGDVISADKVVEFAKAIVARDTVKSEELSNKQKKLSKTAGEAEVIINKYRETKQRLEKIAACEKSITEKTPMLDEFKNNMENAIAQKPRIEEFAIELAKLGENLELYVQLEEIKNQLDAKSERRKNCEDEIVRIDNGLKLIYIQTDENNAILEQTANVEVNIHKTEQTIAECKNTDVRIADIELKQSEYDKLKLRLAKLENDYSRAVDKHKEISTRLSDAKRSFFDEQAGFIALKLKNGEPCPVCGSLEHPVPAQVSNNAPDRADVEELELREKDELKNCSDISSRISAQRAEIAAAESVIADLLKETGIETYDELMVLKESNKLNISVYGRVLSTLKGQLIDREKAEKQNKNAQVRMENIKSDKEKYKIESATLAAEIASLKKQLDDMSDAVTYDNIELAREAYNNKDKEKKALEAYIEKSVADYDKLMEEFKGLQTTLDVLKQQDNTADENKYEEAVSEKAFAEAELENIISADKEVSARIINNNALISKIYDIKAETDKKEKEYIFIASLSKVANGNVSGKAKIMLETYVQMTYFDRIISKANHRLLRMTGGQYELKRRETGDKHNVQSGLELDVIDHHSATCRDVKSLSGGESFKASLCLALGLSDEISASSGGIQIDSMFIDEGFGSLDEESVRMAVDVLCGLGDGSKQIGVISHVAQLRERITRQITVTKDRFGSSSIKVNC